jgi:hypothetical protein
MSVQLFGLTIRIICLSGKTSNMPKASRMTASERNVNRSIEESTLSVTGLPRHQNTGDPELSSSPHTGTYKESENLINRPDLSTERDICNILGVSESTLQNLVECNLGEMRKVPCTIEQQGCEGSRLAEINPPVKNETSSSPSRAS